MAGPASETKNKPGLFSGSKKRGWIGQIPVYQGKVIYGPSPLFCQPPFFGSNYDGSHGTHGLSQRPQVTVAHEQSQEVSLCIGVRLLRTSKSLNPGDLRSFNDWSSHCVPQINVPWLTRPRLKIMRTRSKYIRRNAHATHGQQVTLLSGRRAGCWLRTCVHTHIRANAFCECFMGEYVCV